MENILNNLDAFFGDYFGLNVPDVQVTDVVEIVIIAFFIYHLLIWIKNTRTWMLFRGVLLVVFFFVLAALFQMSTILWLGEKLLNVALIMIIVVFQPELRKALENLGRRRIFSFLRNFGLGSTISRRFEDKTLTDMVMACFEMGAVKTGALIVIENENRLDVVERTGIKIDALLTRQLLINIFEKNTPLHDGAVIVRGDRVVAATCYLPLSENMNLSKALGTRHRAALGVSEVCDALTIVVSEETGRVSVARAGRLTENVTDDELREMLLEMQHPEQQEDEEQDAKKESSRKRERRRARHEAKHDA